MCKVFCLLIFFITTHIAYTTSVENHVLEQIAQSEIIEHPFPALVIDNFLPEDFYQKAIHEFPSFDLSRCDRNRCWFPLSPEKDYFSNYSKKQQAFWLNFNTLMSQVIKPALIEKFGDRFLKKFSLPCYSEHIEDIAKTFKVYCDPKSDVLCLDRTGYGLKTHLDREFIYLKLIIYFPDDESMSSYGTYMVDCDKPAPGSSVLPLETQINGEHFIAYKPNRLVVMMQTPVSWHRIQPHHFSQFRRTYNGNIYVSFNFLRSVTSSIKRNFLPSGSK